MKERIYLLLKTFVSIVFIFSAISKLFPIESFELTIVNQGITGWDLVPYLSRFVIALELAVGLLFLQKNYFRNIIIPVAFFLLVGFTIHLTMIVINSKDIANCGCFGEILPMSPIQAIIKNLVFIAILIPLFFWTKEKYIDSIIPISITVTAFIFVFAFFPIKSYKVFDNKKNELSEKIIKPDTLKTDSSNNYKNKLLSNKKTDSLKIKKQVEEKNPVLKYPRKESIFSAFNDYSYGNIDVNDGLKIIALFSLDCDDCKNTSKEFAKLSERIKIPLYILFFGELKRVIEFFKYSGKEFPYKIILPQEFFPLIKNSPPRVCILINGNIIEDWGEKDFSVSKLEQIIKQFNK